MNYPSSAPTPDAMCPLTHIPELACDGCGYDQRPAASAADEKLDHYRQRVTEAHDRYKATMEAARVYAQKRTEAAYRECQETVAAALGELLAPADDGSEGSRA